MEKEARPRLEGFRKAFLDESGVQRSGLTDRNRADGPQLIPQRKSLFFPPANSFRLSTHMDARTGQRETHVVAFFW